MTSPDLSHISPDYLLTYCNWWSNQTNMPVHKVAIGNPHFTESLSTLGYASGKTKQLLLLGDRIDTNLYLNLASKVYELVSGQGMSVVFRPYPFERDEVRSLQLPYGVQLDSHFDIYPSLKDSSVVISELSTGWFEAIGLVDKVLLWETNRSRFAFPEIPFLSFSTMNELESILNDKESLQKESSTVPASELWAPNWTQNYFRFVEGASGT